MKVNATHEDDLAVIAAGGELDSNTAPLLREAVDQALARGARWLLFDLQGLDFIGSVGIGELIRAAKLLHERDGDLAVACRRPNVTRVFEISGTGELLHLHAEVSAAHAVLQEARRCAPRAGAGEEGEGHG
jgi:anti-sigma B factor antagonist